MTPTLHAFPGACGSVVLYKDEGRVHHVATLFASAAARLGDTYLWNDGGAMQESRVDKSRLDRKAVA